MGRIRSLWLFLGLVLFAVSFYDVTADVTPSENECRPYIEKAIHELKQIEPTATENESIEDDNKTGEDASIETTTTTSEVIDDDKESVENAAADGANSQEQQPASVEEENKEQQSTEQVEDDNKSAEEAGDESSKEQTETAEDDGVDSKEEVTAEEPEAADGQESSEAGTEENKDSKEAENDTAEENAVDDDSKPVEPEGQESDEAENTAAEQDGDSKEVENDSENKESVEVGQTVEDESSKEDDQPQTEEDGDTKEEVTDNNEDSAEEKVRSKRSIADEAAPEDDTKEDTAEETENNTVEEGENDTAEETDNKSGEETDKSVEDAENKSEETDNKSAEESDIKSAEESDNKSAEEAEDKTAEESDNTAEETDNSTGEVTDNSQEAVTEGDSKQEGSQEEEPAEDGESTEEGTEETDTKSEEENLPEEELTLGFEIPKNLRNRGHINDLLGLDAESSIKENALKRTGDVVLKELKRVYDNAIKPLEQMYKYRDLSNRHFGDPEIFSKPLIVFMGPYSGGKSTILNYLTDNEYTPNSIRSGAEPSPAYFNILMHGDEPEVLDGTQLAADWTFSGLQKFGQGLMDRLRGQKLPSKLLERVNIVEIPGILEVRKQVSRYFPFNDACQWFIDRADIIFLVYDPSKLDVGPETEAILDQLKGREYQTRILLNKGDQVKPEELLRVQSALIWNISPLMSSAQPPVMYTVSLWSHPYEQGAPIRLLHAQERAMLSDLREAIDKRIENKIASARRFAVRIRNHAKMVDCYLTTYYNQKSLFSNKKQVSDKIIEHPQNYNIYEGLSTLTNISRYDLPDPEVYLDFFRLNPLYEFKKLSETCTYFKGCPINKLDIAIAYDLPELVGKYKKLLEENYSQLRKEFDENCNSSSVEPPVKLNSRS